MVKSHTKLSCGGKCPVSDHRYHSKLVKTIAEIAKETGRDILPAWRSSFADDGLYVVDPDLHGFVCVGIIPQVETPRQVHGLLKNAIVNKIQRNSLVIEKNSFPAEIEVLLRMAVITRDADLLEKTLKSSISNVRIPSCLKASLLRKSITSFFAEGTRVLLEFGASPEKGLFADYYDRPLARVTNLFVTFDFERNAQGAVVDEQQRNDKVIQLTQITELLIKHGANLLSRILDASTGDIPLHRLAWIALKSPAAAHYIVSATPAQGFHNVHGIFMVFDNPSYSPLTIALHVAARIYQSAFTKEMAANVLIYAVLPLMQAGASCGETDLLYDFDFLKSYSSFLRSSDQAEETSFLIWGRPDVSIEYLLAARRKLSVDVQRLRKVLSSRALQEATVEEGSNIRSFIGTIMSKFPFSLQSQCRQEILSRLPVGYNERISAINTLQLPQVITDYLQYNELVPRF